MSIILFGAGKDGIKAMYEIGRDKISYFVDNVKEGDIEGIPIKKLSDVGQNDLIFVTSRKYNSQIAEQLLNNGFSSFFIYTEGKAVQYKEVDYDKRLSSTNWSEIYNQELLDTTLNNISLEQVSIQSSEMLQLTKKGDCVLEIGCGSGETSLFLAKHGRRVSCLDYSCDIIGLVDKMVQMTGYRCETYCLDAEKKLPFKDKQFDVVFQAGLLEHFQQEEQISLLKNWKRYCRKMISLVPNAHAIAYRVGKYLAEKDGSWKYGMEIPQESMRKQFQEAGLSNITEYTIGEKHALNFLPENHYLRVALEKWISEFQDSERKEYGQGYLLVTIGDNV